MVVVQLKLLLLLQLWKRQQASSSAFAARRHIGHCADSALRMLITLLPPSPPPPLLLPLLAIACLGHGLQGQCRGYDGGGVARAPIHVVLGHGGAGLSTNYAQPDPEWLEVR